MDAPIRIGTIIYAGPDDRQGFDEARDWIKSRGYGKHQVRMVRRKDMILVEAISDLHAK